jgi:hypothetical protein
LNVGVGELAKTKRSAYSIKEKVVEIPIRKTPAHGHDGFISGDSREVSKIPVAVT